MAFLGYFLLCLKLEILPKISTVDKLFWGNQLQLDQGV